MPYFDSSTNSLEINRRIPLSTFLLHSSIPNNPLIDGVHELAELGSAAFQSGVVGETPLAMQSADVVLLAGWEAISESPQVRTSTNAVVAVVVDWPWVEHGLSTRGRMFPSPSEAASLLADVDCVIATEPGIASALESLIGIDALWWPTASAVGGQSADANSLVVVPRFSTHDECAHLVGWLIAAAKLDTDISFSVVHLGGGTFGPHAEGDLEALGVSISEELESGSSAFALFAPHKLSDRRELAAAEREGLHSVLAWMTDSPQLLDVHGGAAVDVAVAGELLGAMVQAAATRRAWSEVAWRQLAQPMPSWKSAERNDADHEAHQSSESLIAASRRASMAPTDVGLRLELADQQFQCGMDRAASDNVRVAMNLASLGAPSAVAPADVVRRLSTRRLALGDTPFADLGAAVKLLGASDPVVREAATTPPFETDGILGVRYYPWASELRVVRRSLTVMVPERHAGVAWWMIEGQFVSDDKSIDGFAVSSQGQELPSASGFDDGRWSVLFAAPQTGPWPRPAEVELDVVTASGQSVSDGVATVDSVRGLSADELCAQRVGGELLVPLLPGVAANSNGMYRDDDGWWIGANSTVVGPRPAGHSGLAIMSMLFSAQQGAQFDWLELRVGDTTVKAFRGESAGGLAQFDANVSEVLRSLPADAQSLKVDVVGHCSWLPPDASSAPFKFLSAGVFAPPAGTEALIDVAESIDTLSPADGFVAVEVLDGESVAWLTGPGRLSRPGGAILQAGSVIEISGPRHMGRECLDALEVSLTGIEVDRVGVVDAGSGWCWIGRVRSTSDTFLPGVFLHLRCDIAHQLSEADSRRASLLVSQVRFGDGAEAAPTRGAAHADLPFLFGSPFSEPFGKGIEGAWVTDSVQFWTDVLPGSTKLIIDGDAAVSREVVESAQLRSGSELVPTVSECLDDGSWRLEGDVAALAGANSVPVLFDLVAGSAMDLSLLVSRVRVV